MGTPETIEDRHCEACESMPIPGVLYQPGSDGAYSIYIERCDECKAYPSDAAAAGAAAEKLGGEVWQDCVGYYLAPKPILVHFLTLHPGDRFRYSEGGPVFRRAPDGEDGRARVECPDGRGVLTLAVQEFEGCFVIPAEIDGDQPEKDD